MEEHNPSKVTVAGSSPATGALGILPYVRGYIEPFPTDYGVLLQRKESKIEIVNDHNGVLMNWWRVMRKCPAAMLDMLEEGIPEDYGLTWEHFEIDMLDMDNPDVCAATSLSQAMIRHAPAGTEGYEEKLEWLCDRLYDVQVECKSPSELLERIKDVEDSVIYCTNMKCYINMEEIIDLLRKQASIVAIYGSHYDLDYLLENHPGFYLGWYYHDYEDEGGMWVSKDLRQQAVLF